MPPQEYDLLSLCLQLAQIAQPLERPVIVVREVGEEDKLLAIVSSRESVYMRISPLQDSVTVRADRSHEYAYQQVNRGKMHVDVLFHGVTQSM